MKKIYTKGDLINSIIYPRRDEIVSQDDLVKKVVIKKTDNLADKALDFMRFFKKYTEIRKAADDGGVFKPDLGSDFKEKLEKIENKINSIKDFEFNKQENLIDRLFKDKSFNRNKMNISTNVVEGFVKKIKDFFNKMSEDEFSKSTPRARIEGNVIYIDPSATEEEIMSVFMGKDVSEINTMNGASTMNETEIRDRRMRRERLGITKAAKRKKTPVKPKKYRNVPDKYFFMSPKKGYDRWAYPVNTKRRARAALRYGARFLPPAEYKKLRRFVHRFYPDLGNGK